MSCFDPGDPVLLVCRNVTEGLAHATRVTCKREDLGSGRRRLIVRVLCDGEHVIRSSEEWDITMPVCAGCCGGLPGIPPFRHLRDGQSMRYFDGLWITHAGSA